ncbi:hypothetical protein ACVWY2_000085 [Bradyrhizobium sp. JR6.1]
MTKEMRKKREENCLPSAKTYRGTLLSEQQNDERRVRDALDDDEVREALKLMHERNERAREKAGRERFEDSGDQSRGRFFSSWRKSADFRMS